MVSICMFDGILENRSMKKVNKVYPSICLMVTLRSIKKSISK